MYYFQCWQAEKERRKERSGKPCDCGCGGAASYFYFSMFFFIGKVPPLLLFLFLFIRCCQFCYFALLLFQLFYRPGAAIGTNIDNIGAKPVDNNIGKAGERIRMRNNGEMGNHASDANKEMGNYAANRNNNNDSDNTSTLPGHTKMPPVSSHFISTCFTFYRGHP